MDMLAFILDNGADVAAILFAIHALAVLIVKLTPTPSDDLLVGKLYGLVEFVAGILSVKRKPAD